MQRQLRQILGENVRQARETAGISKINFCLMAGISRPLLDVIERGESNLTLDNLERVANSLDITASELLTPKQGRSKR